MWQCDKIHTITETMVHTSTFSFARKKTPELVQGSSLYPTAHQIIRDRMKPSWVLLQTFEERCFCDVIDPQCRNRIVGINVYFERFGDCFGLKHYVTGLSQVASQIIYFLGLFLVWPSHSSSPLPYPFHSKEKLVGGRTRIQSNTWWTMDVIIFKE